MEVKSFREHDGVAGKKLYRVFAYEDEDDLGTQIGTYVKWTGEKLWAVQTHPVTWELWAVSSQEKAIQLLKKIYLQQSISAESAG